MQGVKQFLKNEIVLVISFVLALVSSVVVGVDKEYIGYIDFRTLGLLFCLMAITSAFNRQGIFSSLAKRLLKLVHSTRALCIVFSLLCFFSSMLITNDVSLITFVPFTILTLKVSGNTKPLIPLVVLETISANLGSMLTPIGNPQNLYLFSYFNMSMSDFITTIGPYALLSFVSILVCTLIIGNENLQYNESVDEEYTRPNVLVCTVYLLLFVVALLTVFRVVNYIVLLALTLLVILIFDRKNIAEIDYSLLLTFVFLFVFIGNLGRVHPVKELLASIIAGNEVLVGVASSQVFSNVPAAILLSGFSTDAKALLVGVNLGGLGTLIASMASLISFKLVAKEDVNKSKYIAVFTVLNIAFLVANLVLWLIIR